MNTYNDNLHSTVSDSLYTQELEQKKINAELTASMFTLYYAEGGRITAAEKLEKAQEDLHAKTLVKEQAVENSNISTNMLMSATQGKSYVDQSVTNTAVAAANVQVAANSILQLSADMGSIYSIVSAADYDTEIYEHSKQAYSIMNTTSYNAEKLSQHAMEASALTAEISMNTVADKAKLANTSVDDILKVADTEYTDASTKVTEDNAKLATANTKEQAAEGKLEDVNVEFRATNDAYNTMNKQLNLNLVIPQKNQTSNSFTVSFNAIKAPFPPPHSKGSGSSNSEFLMMTPPTGYPVETYYVIIVKDEKKRTFAIAEAENIIEKDPKWYTKIDPNPSNFLKLTSPNSDDSKKKTKDKIEQNISIIGKYDSDGDQVVRGQDYVVFVMAVYLNSYKKLLNNFDDFLSAPSPEFTLTYNLEPANYKNFSFVTEDKNGKTVASKNMTNTFQFTMPTTANNGMKLQYRCVFLPASKNITEGLLTVNGLATIEKETERIERISNFYDPKIAQASSEYNDVLGNYNESLENMDSYQQTMNKLKKQLEKAIADDDTDQINELNQQIEGTQKQMELTLAKMQVLEPQVEDARQKLMKLEKKKKNALNRIDVTNEGKSGVFYNVQIAEQVAAGNYTVAHQMLIPLNDKKLKPPTKGKKDAPIEEAPVQDQIWQVTIEADTTDNFGNPLMVKNKYVPVVLSYSTAPEENADQFVNALSNYKHTKAYVFTGIAN